MGVPDGICGFHSHEDGDVPDDWGAAACCRSTWGEEARCVWHAPIDGKPVSALSVENATHHRHVYGAYLRDVTFPRGFSLADWTLPGADFAGADLVEADFRRAHLPGADFSDALLTEANFTEANLVDADLSRTNAARIDVLDAVLDGARFDHAAIPDASLVRASAFEASFDDAVLSNVVARETGLERASLRSADLTKADFEGAVLRDATLDGVLARSVDFSGSALVFASLTDANLDDALLRGVRLERANLTRARLFDADLTGATLYGATTRGVQANSGTTFPDPTYADPDRVAWEYRMTERIARDNALSRLGRESFQAQKDVRRAQYRDDDDYFQWLYLLLTGGLMRYGVSWVRLMFVSGGVVVLFALLFAGLGGVKPTLSPEPAIGFLNVNFDVGPRLETLLLNLYFSAVTFTTLGYGDLQPANGVTKSLASVEAFAGAVLVALLVYVFGRRAEW